MSPSMTLLATLCKGDNVTIVTQLQHDTTIRDKQNNFGNNRQLKNQDNKVIFRNNEVKIISLTLIA